MHPVDSDTNIWLQSIMQVHGFAIADEVKVQACSNARRNGEKKFFTKDDVSAALEKMTIHGVFYHIKDEEGESDQPKH